MLGLIATIVFAFFVFITIKTVFKINENFKKNNYKVNKSIILKFGLIVVYLILFVIVSFVIFFSNYLINGAK